MTRLRFLSFVLLGLALMLIALNGAVPMASACGPDCNGGGPGFPPVPPLNFDGFNLDSLNGVVFCWVHQSPGGGSVTSQIEISPDTIAGLKEGFANLGAGGLDQFKNDTVTWGPCPSGGGQPTASASILTTGDGCGQYQLTNLTGGYVNVYPGRSNIVIKNEKPLFGLNVTPGAFLIAQAGGIGLGGSKQGLWYTLYSWGSKGWVSLLEFRSPRCMTNGDLLLFAESGKVSTWVPTGWEVVPTNGGVSYTFK